MIYSGYKVRKIDCPESLESEVKAHLIGELTKIARNAFGTEVTNEDVANHIFPVSTMTLAELADKKEIVGFATTDHYGFENFSILYLVGTCILREYQGNGIFSELIDKAVGAELNKTTNPELFVTRTQNPVLYAGVKGLVKTVFPNPTDLYTEILDFGKKFAHILGGELTDSFVMKEAYGSQMYDEIPRSRCEEDNQLFDQLLNYEKGDAVLVIGKLKKF